MPSSNTKIKTIESVSEFRDAERGAPRPLGLVPTMGGLHEGHLSLVRRARADNATVVASIFVNPTQFGVDEDLSSYPRDIDGDLAKLEREGVDLVFAPPHQELYGPGFSTYVDVGHVAERLEGPPVPATSGVWPPSYASCSPSCGPTAPTSARRTLSSAWWSSA